MTQAERIITIAMVVLGTMTTRFLPFLLFSGGGGKTPEYIRYLGKALPLAVFGLLVVFSLKDVNPFVGSRGIPELSAVLFVTALHVWRRQMMLSIAGGTLFYMALVQFVF